MTPEPACLMFVPRKHAVPTLADVDVVLASTGATIGTLRWHIPYRQYVFEPTLGSRFNLKCLTEIRTQLAALMRAWSKSRARKPYEHGDYATAAPRTAKRKRATIAKQLEESLELRKEGT